MRKFFYITQLSAVALLMVQLSGCGSMPDPEPISDKYAKPTEVIAAGVPVVNADGISVYTPENGKFRFAGTIFANADGTMTSWYSTPGGATGTLPSPTGLSGATGAYPFHSAGDYGDLVYTFTKDFYAWGMSCPSWSSATAGTTFSLYSWAGDLDGSLAGTPLGSVDFVPYVDNSWLDLTADNSGYADASGNTKFPAGKYVMHMVRVQGAFGFWGTGSVPENMTMYKNGEAQSWVPNTHVQYVAPADISFASQARSYTAKKIGLTTEWTGNDDNIIVAPTSEKADRFYAKELSVVKAGEYYYIAYTGSATVKEGTDNAIFVARSTTPDGKNWEKWNGTGWGGDPAPVVSTTLSEPAKFYGVGQPSMVVKDGTLFLYYTFSDDETAIYNTHMLTASATDPNWPATIADKGMVIDRSSMKNMDGVSVVYAEETGKFIAICGVNIDAASSYVATWESADGITGWKQTGTLVSNIRVYAKYPRFVTNSEGHVTSAAHYLIYQYGTARNSYKTWMCSFKFAE